MYFYLARQIIPNTVCNITTFTKKCTNTFLTSPSQEQKAISKYILSSNKPSDDDIEYEQITEDRKLYKYKHYTNKTYKNECCVMEYSKTNKDAIYCYCFTKDIKNFK
jgi:hypothetical protein